MISLSRYITEELDENIFWKIEKYFENDKPGLSLFNSLIDICRNNKSYNIKTIEAYLSANKEFNKQLKQFIDFLQDVIHEDPESNTDYVNVLFKLVKIIIGNKTEGIKFTNIIQ